ncbi:MAG TPA: Tex family protein [Chitinophagaceae bacterium]|nr:Tex family protein [Chitinophagaceae bacterium]
MLEFADRISQKLSLRLKSVEAVLELLHEGATIPFIARYRKDRTGGVDEVIIQQIQDEAKFQKEFSERKSFIIKAITEQNKMTPQLSDKIEAASTLTELEDIYLPYKPKRKTKAQTARENGLQPLADLLMLQKDFDIAGEAATLLNDKIKSTDEALQGARDIIAEVINEDAQVRTRVRKLFEEEAKLHSKVLEGKEVDAAKYKDYFEYSEKITTIPSHRMLAVLRGFVEGFLRMSIAPEEESALLLIENLYIKGDNNCSEHIRRAVKDAYKRLLQPSLESEFRTALKAKADEEAINVFAENLRQLLLSSPLGNKRLLAIDPGYRTGCKVVCLDEKGDLLKTSIIYIHESNKKEEALFTIRELVGNYKPAVFAIGDGTAGRETQKFIKELNLGLPVFLVNEDGASVYSASEIAREEFADEDITVRGAVSIGRRLMDPLAELVKIDPKSIGVGQYQHDVNQFRLKEKLDQTVVSCVNKVGVNLNTASKHLLSYVSGIGPTLADNIVKYRSEIGQFKGREQLLKVPRLGGKVFEQCAGFLRIKGGDNPLDATSVHPEAYPVVQSMAKDLNTGVNDLIANENILKQININKYVTEQVGALTIKDILTELNKPGLDPRTEVQQFDFANVYTIEDVKVGDVLPGIVTNITRFGAFVDIGVKQDGLVHVSEIANRFISDPSEVLKLNQQVKVKVLEVDIIRKRISLSIKQTLEHGDKKSIPQNHNKKKKEISSLPMQDALAELKKKFAK